jgi:hypothetical protein
VDAEEASMIGARARKIRRPRAEPGGCGRLNRDRQAVPIDAGARSARFQPAPPARGPGGRSWLLGGRPHGQPYLPVDRETAAAMPAISEISLALHNATLDDVPDPRARPLPALVEAAARQPAPRQRSLCDCRSWSGRGAYGVARPSGRPGGAGRGLSSVAYLMARRTGRTSSP